jgi:hypothetical protein
LLFVLAIEGDSGWKRGPCMQADRHAGIKKEGKGIKLVIVDSIIS